MRKIHTDGKLKLWKNTKITAVKTVVRSFQRLLDNQCRLKDMLCSLWIGRIMLMG